MKTYKKNLKKPSNQKMFFVYVCLKTIFSNFLLLPFFSLVPPSFSLLPLSFPETKKMFLKQLLCILDLFIVIGVPKTHLEKRGEGVQVLGRNFYFYFIFFLAKRVVYSDTKITDGKYVSKKTQIVWKKQKKKSCEKTLKNSCLLIFYLNICFKFC